MDNDMVAAIRRNAEHIAVCYGLDVRHKLLIQMVRELCDAVEGSEGVLAMAVARLGGMVEGRPTARLNFLQRIDRVRCNREAAFV